MAPGSLELVQSTSPMSMNLGETQFASPGSSTTKCYNENIINVKTCQVIDEVLQKIDLNHLNQDERKLAEAILRNEISSFSKMTKI